MGFREDPCEQGYFQEAGRRSVAEAGERLENEALPEVSEIKAFTKFERGVPPSPDIRFPFIEISSSPSVLHKPILLQEANQLLYKLSRSFLWLVMKTVPTLPIAELLPLPWFWDLIATLKAISHFSLSLNFWPSEAFGVLPNRTYSLFPCTWIRKAIQQAAALCTGGYLGLFTPVIHPGLSLLEHWSSQPTLFLDLSTALFPSHPSISRGAFGLVRPRQSLVDRGDQKMLTLSVYDRRV